MTDAPANPLDDDDFVAALLDTLIPEDGPMPGAAKLDLVASFRNRIAAIPMLAGPLTMGLMFLQQSAQQRDPGGFAALDPAARTEVLAALVEAQPAFAMVQAPLLGFYYGHPKVREALGQPSKPPFPDGYTIEDTVPELLEKLQTRRTG